MSNPYVQFCLVIKRITAEEEAWIQQITALDRFGEDAEKARALTDLGLTDEDDFALWPSFEAELRGKPGNLEWWFYSDEPGNPDQVAQAVKAFLAKFRPKGFVAFEVAYSGDKAGPEAFGGAGYLVTAEKIEVQGTLDWIHAKVKEYEKQGKEQF